MSKKMSKDLEKMFEETGRIHHLWYDFQDHMGKMYYDLRRRWSIKAMKRNGSFVETKRKFKHFNPKKMTGHEAICWLRKFIENNHPDLIEVRCDDSAHCGSSVFLIPHETDKEYWGTTVVYIPQCTDDQNMFFLYPDHLNRFVKELQKIQMRTQAKGIRPIFDDDCGLWDEDMFDEMLEDMETELCIIP